MKFIKLAVISIVGFFLLLTAFSLLLPSKVIISRAIDINAPLDSVYNMVNDLSKWHLWMDNYESTPATLSANAKGENANIKMGLVKVVINKTTPEKIEATWQSGENTALPGSFNFFSNDSFGHITLQWQFIQKVKWYPWEKFATIVSDNALGPYMEKSLDNLKKQVE